MGLSNIKDNSIKNWRPAGLLTLFLTLLLTLIPGLSFSASASSNQDFEEERWFEVELIVFAHKNGEALESEEWPEIVGLTLPEGMVELNPPPPEEPEATPPQEEQSLIFEQVIQPSTDTTPLESNQPVEPMPVAFEILDEGELQLKDAIKKLKRSSKFEPLLHVAWRQPTYDKKHVQTVLLYEGMTDPLPETADEKNDGEDPSLEGLADKDRGNLSPAPTAAEENLPPEPVYATEDDANIGPMNPRFAGTIRLSVARYLHFAADLVYRTPITQRVAVPIPDLELWYDRPYPTLSELQGPAYQLEEWSATRGYRLLESRRMRSKRIHYLDHPFLGVMVLITPVKLPEKPEEVITDPLNNIASPSS